MIDPAYFADLKCATAGNEINTSSGVIVAVAWPYLKPGNTCGECPVGRHDCELTRLHQACLDNEIVFRMKDATKGE